MSLSIAKEACYHVLLDRPRRAPDPVVVHGGDAVLVALAVLPIAVRTIRQQPQCVIVVAVRVSHELRADVEAPAQ